MHTVAVYTTIQHIHCRYYSNIMCLIYFAVLQQQGSPPKATDTVDVNKKNKNKRNNRTWISVFLLNTIWKLQCNCPNNSFKVLQFPCFALFAKISCGFEVNFSSFLVLTRSVVHIVLCLRRQKLAAVLYFCYCQTGKDQLKIKQPQLHYWLLSRNGTKDRRDPRRHKFSCHLNKPADLAHI